MMLKQVKWGWGNQDDEVEHIVKGNVMGIQDLLAFRTRISNIYTSA